MACADRFRKFLPTVTPNNMIYQSNRLTAQNLLRFWAMLGLRAGCTNAEQWLTVAGY
jgi:hypothetical protein